MFDDRFNNSGISSTTQNRPTTSLSFQLMNFHIYPLAVVGVFGAQRIEKPRCHFIANTDFPVAGQVPDTAAANSPVLASIFTHCEAVGSLVRHHEDWHSLYFVLFTAIMLHFSS